MRGLSLGAAVLGLLAMTPAGGAADAQADAIKAAQADTATKDVLIFKNGNVVEGKILEETDTTIKVLVKFGAMSAPTEYHKSEILEIQRDVATGDAPKKDDAPATDGEKTDGDKAKPATSDADGEKTVKIYLVEMKGEAFRDVSPTPMEQIVKDIIEQEPDYVVYKINFDFALHQQEKRDWEMDFEREHVEQLEKARELDTIINDKLSIYYPKAKKPELICWINKALGSAAFIPLSFSHTYYTSEGRHGGLGYMDFMFIGVGDEVVRQKQISLRLGRARGQGAKGGYPQVIVDAMTRTLDVLSVDFVGGRPVYHNDYSGAEMLTDAGVGPEQDNMQDVIRGRGNDSLTLNADTAFRLGISDGTVNTIDELAHELGIERHYEVVSEYPARVLKRWSEDVNNAESNILRLFREFVQLPVEGDYNDRKAARGKKIALLEQARSLLMRYSESINPYNLGSPDANISQINITIEGLKTSQRLDRR